VGTEAACHSVEEYMTHVEDYYRTLEVNGSSVARRIFLASDDAQVIEEARRKYPQYQIIGDPEVARMASVSTRYTDTALNGIILDIHLRLKGFSEPILVTMFCIGFHLQGGKGA